MILAAMLIPVGLIALLLLFAQIRDSLAGVVDALESIVDIHPCAGASGRGDVQIPVRDPDVTVWCFLEWHIILLFLSNE